MSTENLLCRKNSQECSCEWGVIEANPHTNGERVAIHVDGIWQRSIAILIGQVEVKVVVGIQIWKIFLKNSGFFFVLQQNNRLWLVQQY